MPRGRPAHPDILTPRQWEVLALIEKGKTNEEIAETLDISFAGAKFHVAEILSKLGVGTREEAVITVRRGEKRFKAISISPFGLLSIFRPRADNVSPLFFAVALASVVALISFVVFAWPFASNSDVGPGGEELSRAIADFERSLDGENLAAAEFDPNGCVTGQDARNRRVESGGRELVLPETRTFASVAEAEAWLCMPIPQPRVWLHG